MATMNPNGIARIYRKRSIVASNPKYVVEEVPARITPQEIRVDWHRFGRVNGHRLNRYNPGVPHRCCIAYRLDGSNDWTITTAGAKLPHDNTGPDATP